jgi:putative ABC transport system permease protein
MFTESIVYWYRFLLRQRIYTLICLVGLSAGFAGFNILSGFIINEISYDRKNNDLDKIFRINTRNLQSDITYARAPYVMAGKLMQDIGEDADITSIFHMSGCTVRKGEDYIDETDVFSADNSLFSVLTFKVIGGDVSKFLANRRSAVVTESLAKKYFGDDYPVGKDLFLVNNGISTELKITGLIEDLPQNSSFRPTILVSNELALELMDLMIMTSSDEPLGKEYFANSWDTYLFFTTLVRVSGESAVPGLSLLLSHYEKEYYSDKEAVNFDLQPYRSIYLDSSGIRAADPVGDKRTVITYSIVAIVLLFLVGFNYILLTDAVMRTRRKELEIRRVNGSLKRELVRQILTENLLLVAFSAVIGAIAMELVLPHVGNVLFGKQLEISYSGNRLFLIIAAGVPFIIGLISGLIVAIKYTERSGPSVVQSAKVSQAGFLFKRSIIVVQLTVALTLMVCTSSIYRQIEYFTTADIGFDLNNLISISIRDRSAKVSYETLKEQISSLSGVESVTGSMWTPPTRSSMTMTAKRVDNPDEKVVLQGLMADYNFAGTLGLRILEGRDFTEGVDSPGGIILNQSAVRALGISGSASGTILSFGKVTGVVEDFHIHSFHKAVPPMLIHLTPQGVRTLLVRFNVANSNELIRKIENKWKSVVPDSELNYTFLTDAVEELYSQEKRSAKILMIFSVLTLVIGLLGIFGMASLNTIQRRREVGIKKILGADSNSIIRSFILRYVSLSFASSVVALPVAYLLILRWLSGFAYYEPISALSYLIPVFIVTVTVIITVFWNVMNAARTNPVETIRYS